MRSHSEARAPATGLLLLCHSTDQRKLNGNVAAMELPGIVFWGEGRGAKQTQSFLCQVLVWMGQLCVGVFCVLFFFLLFWFLFCFLMMFTICLNHSVFYKDSTSSPLPSPHPGLQGC